MTRTILGLDVGGANLKAATPDGRAVSVPFALWKHPDRLPAALAELVGRFEDVGELAVTMTGELCDCYETKRQGVNAILDAVEFAAAGRPVRVWGTGGDFLTPTASRVEYMTVAAANWHALATFAGRLMPDEGGLLVDVGSTTTDIVPFNYGIPVGWGLTDRDRLLNRELVYLGAVRTPVCAVTQDRTAAELFATMLDVCLVLGRLPSDPSSTDTADRRPATVEHARGRLARMLGGDTEDTSVDETIRFAAATYYELVRRVSLAIGEVWSNQQTVTDLRTVVVAGVGVFIAAEALGPSVWLHHRPTVRHFDAEFGPAVSACAPAYAVAVLASERPQ